jgi:hypothetical protein
MQWRSGSVSLSGRKYESLDYIEGIGYAWRSMDELRRRHYQNAIRVLPHDGVNENNITGKGLCGTS